MDWDLVCSVIYFGASVYLSWRITRATERYSKLTDKLVQVSEAQQALLQRQVEGTEVHYQVAREAHNRAKVFHCLNTLHRLRLVALIMRAYLEDCLLTQETEGKRWSYLVNWLHEELEPVHQSISALEGDLEPLAVLQASTLVDGLRSTAKIWSIPPEDRPSFLESKLGEIYEVIRHYRKHLPAELAWMEGTGGKDNAEELTPPL